MPQIYCACRIVQYELNIYQGRICTGHNPLILHCVFSITFLSIRIDLSTSMSTLWSIHAREPGSFTWYGLNFEHLAFVQWNVTKCEFQIRIQSATNACTWEMTMAVAFTHPVLPFHQKSRISLSWHCELAGIMRGGTRQKSHYSTGNHYASHF